MATVEDILKKHEGEIKSLKEQEKLPWYLAKNPKQMYDQLEKMGIFNPSEEGLQDDLANAGRLFTETNDRGDLVPGLDPSLIRLFQTMDLRGVLWNYGLGAISAFKGGRNVQIAKGRRDADVRIENVRKEVNSNSEIENIKNYINSQADFNELRGQVIPVIDPATNNVVSYIHGPRSNPPNNVTVYSTYDKDTKGWEPYVRQESTPTADTYPDYWISPKGDGHSNGSEGHAHNGSNAFGENIVFDKDAVVEYLLSAKGKVKEANIVREHKH
jgi:hypothetical protein